MRTAVAWGTNIDEKTLKEITSHVSLGDRLKEYQVQAESKVMLLVSIKDPAQLQVSQPFFPQEFLENLPSSRML